MRLVQWRLLTWPEPSRFLPLTHAWDSLQHSSGLNIKDTINANVCVGSSSSSQLSKVSSKLDPVAPRDPTLDNKRVDKRRCAACVYSAVMRVQLLFYAPRSLFIYSLPFDSSFSRCMCWSAAERFRVWIRAFSSSLWYHRLRRRAFVARRPAVFTIRCILFPLLCEFTQKRQLIH